MIDDVADIAAFYGEDPEREHGRLDEHQLERELTWRYLGRHLPAGGSVLEGAGTGQYTVGLARRGYRVTAIDLSPELLDLASAQLDAVGLAANVNLVVADARDLTSLADGDFDAALLMGPLYHLVDEADRRLAIRQAWERMRPGGVIVTAFLSRLGVIGDLMRRIPDWIEDEAHVRSFLDRGRRPDDAPLGGFRGYFARVEEIGPIHEEEGFETIEVVGVEPAISAQDESFNELEGKQRELWLDLLQEIGSEASIVGASRHLLYIGRKIE